MNENTGLIVFGAGNAEHLGTRLRNFGRDGVDGR
jgi:hypothetical protein